MCSVKETPRCRLDEHTDVKGNPRDEEEVHCGHPSGRDRGGALRCPRVLTVWRMGAHQGGMMRRQLGFPPLAPPFI
jgi:hypothetical protein